MRWRHFKRAEPQLLTDPSVFPLRPPLSFRAICSLALCMSVPDNLPVTPDLTGTCWRDDMFLQYYGIHPSNVLDYFSLSIFYDRSCNNEVAKLRGMPITQLPSLPPGVEYGVVDNQPPHLFLIRKQYRSSPSTTTPLAYYYVLDGTVYQAPTLYSALSARMSRCMYQLRTAFHELQQDLHPLSQGAQGGDESALERELRLGREPPKQLSAWEREQVSKAASIITAVVHQVRQHPMAEPLAAAAAAAAVGGDGGAQSASVAPPAAPGAAPGEPSQP